jgi:hypothetical protein
MRSSLFWDVTERILEVTDFWDNQRSHLQGSRGWTDGDDTDRPETSVISNILCVTSQKTEDLKSLTKKLFVAVTTKKKYQENNLTEKYLFILAFNNFSDRRIL